MMQQRVVIGMDPHKRSVTVEVMEADETIVGHDRFGTDVAGFAHACRLRRLAGRIGSGRSRAVKGSAAMSRNGCSPLGEQVVDVPAKLSARMRMFATGQGRKTDDTDAHSIALVGCGSLACSRSSPMTSWRCCDCWSTGAGGSVKSMSPRSASSTNCYWSLSRAGRRRTCPPPRPARSWPAVRPKDDVGKLRKRVALELVVDLERIYLRKKQANKELVTLLKTTGTGLLDLHGIGPTGAARLLVEVGDITRSPTVATSRLGPAPPPSMCPPVTGNTTGSPAAGTGRSTWCCT